MDWQTGNGYPHIVSSNSAAKQLLLNQNTRVSFPFSFYRDEEYGDDGVFYLHNFAIQLFFYEFFY